MVPIALATHSRAAGARGVRQLPEKRILPQRRGLPAQVAWQPPPWHRGPPPTLARAAPREHAGLPHSRQHVAGARTRLAHGWAPAWLCAIRLTGAR